MLITPDAFRALNSLTQYPKIPTFHVRGADGTLSEETRSYIPDAQLYLTEKVDGENVRVVVLPTGEYLIGSRTEWLTMSGDRVYNDKGGMVDTVREAAQEIVQKAHLFFPRTKIVSFFFEVYGGKTTPQWRQYGDGESCFRLFDIAEYDVEQMDYPLEAIARWREENDEAGVWLSESALESAAEFFNLALTPRLAVIPAYELPQSIQAMREFLESYEQTQVSALNHEGKSEGLVVSTHGRMRGDITKIKFKDYDKVLSKRADEQRAAAKAARQAAAMAGRA